VNTLPGIDKSKKSKGFRQKQSELKKTMGLDSSKNGPN